MAPLPSMFGGRDSSVTTCSWRSWSSAASSMVTMRSSFGMKRREHVQGRGLAGAGAARDEDVEASFHAGAQEVEHLRRRRAEPDQVVHRERRGRELADGDHGSDQGQRRDDRVDAGAVGQAGVDHRARLVDAAADRGDDPIDDAHDVVVVLEDDVGQLQAAAALDVDLARAVDHDFGDGLVAEQRLERTEADDLVRDLLEHADALGAGEGQALLVDDAAEDLLDLTADLDLVGQVELGVQVLDDAGLDPELDLAQGLPDGSLGERPLPTRTGHSRRTWRRSRGPAGRSRRHTRSGALDSLQKGHRLHPLSAPPGIYLHAKRDLPFWGALLPSSSRASWLPTIDVARRSTSWETWLSRLLRTNGTPRLRA